MDIDEIQTREDFVKFVYDLRDECRNNPASCQNDTTESFLDGLGGWVEDMDGAYLNWNKSIAENISWRVIAQMLLAARSYD